MSQPVIRIEQLGKAFARAKRPAATRIVDEIAGWLRSGPRSDVEDFWAVRDVSLDIRVGEIVGLIGHNGAGKSTLLKLLCRILHPTTGRIRLRGRVGSLLEVGTGFHPELTGRENIYLNGAILGMSRREIATRFDEIVAFSEVEAFLDTPIKHYSSGMAVRLAFAVAAHLEPEILLVDEVLGVGDISFQRKSLGRIQELSEKSGRTILMVSHNVAALASLCTRGILLEQGQVQFDGPIQEALHRYQERGTALGTEWIGPSGDQNAQLLRAWARPADGSSVWDTGRPLEIGAELNILRPIDGLVYGFRLQSEYGADLAYTLYDDGESGVAETVPPGRITQTWKIPADTLAAGRYRIAFEVALAYRHVCHQQPFGELAFEMQNLTGPGRRYPVQGVRGFDSLLRPVWADRRHIEPLSEAQR